MSATAVEAARMLFYGADPTVAKEAAAKGARKSEPAANVRGRGTGKGQNTGQKKRRPPVREEADTCALV